MGRPVARLVRDLARQLKKEINLELVGEETDLDKNLVEALADPLVHLVRNSVDHGIEEPTEREAMGKPRSGKVILSAAFEREGDVMPTTGTLSLFIGDEKVGEGRIMTQPGNFSLVGEGLNVGKDPGEAVTDDYPGERPFAFSGGTIEEVIVDVSGAPFVDLEREAVAIFARE